MLPEDQDGSRKFKKGRPGHLPTELNVIYFTENTCNIVQISTEFHRNLSSKFSNLMKFDDRSINRFFFCYDV